MAKLLLEGSVSKEQHAFLKCLAQRVHDKAIQLGIHQIDKNDDEARRLTLDIVLETNELQKWLDVMTETGGPARFQAYLDQLKIKQIEGGKR
jgi:hypothetical protein